MENHKKITEVRSEQWEPDHERRIFTFKVTQFIWLLLGILEALLALRVLLKLFAANPNSPIAALIYSLTGIFLVPFSSLTSSPSVSGMVLEISTFFAMLIYALIGWAVERLVWILLYRPSGSMVEVTKTRSQEDNIHQHEL
jgi:hypothetical protein